MALTTTHLVWWLLVIGIGMWGKLPTWKWAERLVSTDTQCRYFLRVMLPIPIRGEARQCNWGIWVEVSAADFYPEPDFTFDDDVDHAFAREQRDGVFPERRLEWLMRRAHE